VELGREGADEITRGGELLVLLDSIATSRDRGCDYLASATVPLP
jgi:hypothetical protein